MKVKNNRKVLILSPLPPPIGGIASWSLNLLQFIKELQYENIIHLNTAIKSRKITQNNIFSRIYYGLFDSTRILFLIFKNCIFYRPKIVHLTSSASFGLFRDLIIGLICKILSIKFVIHFRFGRIPELAIQNNWEWKMIVLLIKISNQSIIIDLLSFETLKAKKINNVYLVPNPCSSAVEKLAQRKTREYLPNSLLFVGHIIPTKGVFEILEAINSIKKNILVSMIGPYEYNIKKKLAKLASQKNEGLWLMFLGEKNKEEVLEMMQKSYLLILPSYTEGFPNVIIEAMASGCPVIATDVGAIPEMLDSDAINASGVCVKVGDVNALKNAIEFLINNPLERNNMAINGKHKVLNNYTMSHIFKEYERIWNM